MNFKKCWSMHLGCLDYIYSKGAFQLSICKHSCVKGDIGYAVEVLNGRVLLEGLQLVPNIDFAICLSPVVFVSGNSRLFKILPEHGIASRCSRILCCKKEIQITFKVSV